MSATGTVNFKVTLDPLPPDTNAALGVLHERTQRLMDILMETRVRTDETFAAHAAEDSRLRDEIRAAVDRLENIDRRLAIGGIRTQALGLFLTVLGIVLATLPI